VPDADVGASEDQDEAGERFEAHSFAQENRTVCDGEPGSQIRGEIGADGADAVDERVEEDEGTATSTSRSTADPQPQPLPGPAIRSGPRRSDLSPHQERRASSDRPSVIWM
jgi:hypothetical protein